MVRYSDNKKTASLTQSSIIRFLQKNRGKPQYRPAPPAARAVAKIIRPLSKKYGGAIYELRQNWQQIIGSRWANLSRPVRLQSGKSGKTLIIAAKGPAASLIEADSLQIIARINQYLGANAIAKIKIRQMAINNNSELPKKLDIPATRAINDDENTDKSGDKSLQELLSRLEGHIKGKSR